MKEAFIFTDFDGKEHTVSLDTVVDAEISDDTTPKYVNFYLFGEENLLKMEISDETAARLTEEFRQALNERGLG